MANISSYNQLSSWNEDDDLLFVQQPDAPKKAHPSQMKEYVEAGDFEATGEVKDGHGNILAKKADITYVDNAVATKANITDVNAALATKANMTTVTIPRFNTSQAGWRRICKIKPVDLQTVEGMIYVGGFWSNGQQPSATVAVSIMNTTASLTLLSSAFLGTKRITAMRLVADTEIEFWLDVYFPAYSSLPGPFKLKFTGDIAVSDIQDPISITTDATVATAEISFNQNVNGTVLTDKSTGLSDVTKIGYLNGVTSDVQAQIDSIGTASATKVKTASISAMGWYRFAKTVNMVNHIAAYGAAGILTNFNIQRNYDNSDNEVYSLSLALTTDKPIFKVMNASVKGQLITKVRYVIDSASSTVGYLEFYYGYTVTNGVIVSLDRNIDFDLIDITQNTASSPVIVGECDLTGAIYSVSGTVLTDKSLETKYLHYISIQRYNESDNFPTYDVLIPIINNTAATMTKTEILAYLDEHGHIKPLHGMYIYRTNGNITSAEPVVDFVYAYYEGSEDKRLIFYRFEHEEHTLTTDAPNLRIEDRFVVQIMQNA